MLPAWAGELAARPAIKHWAASTATGALRNRAMGSLLRVRDVNGGSCESAPVNCPEGAGYLIHWLKSPAAISAEVRVAQCLAPGKKRGFCPGRGRPRRFQPGLRGCCRRSE